jgi:hypothetical protein
MKSFRSRLIYLLRMNILFEVWLSSVLRYFTPLLLLTGDFRTAICLYGDEPFKTGVLRFLLLATGVK